MLDPFQVSVYVYTKIFTVIEVNYFSFFNHYYWIDFNRIRWKKERKIRAIMPLKVIQVHRGRTYHSKARMRLPIVINSNWHPISHRFGVIAAYCSHFGHFVFLSLPLENVRFLSWAHWKARSGLPISVNWTSFRWVLRLRRYGQIGSKIGDFAPTQSLWPRISRRRRPHQSFLHG